MYILIEHPLGDVLSAASGKGRRMDRVRFITHQGKQILFMGVMNCAAEEVIQLLTQVQRIVTAQPRNSMLTLGELTGAQFNRAAVTRLKEVAAARHLEHGSTLRLNQLKSIPKEYTSA